MDEETGWNAFEARMWESNIARWIAIDPARQYYSPYLGMGNVPTNRVDPDGRCDDCPDKNIVEIGATFGFDIDGPHAGAEYLLTENGWIRIDLPMMDELIVTPGSSWFNEILTNSANAFVDIPTTLVSSLRNGYLQWYTEYIKGESIYNKNDYNEWKSFYLGYDWKLHKNVDLNGNNINNGIENNPTRAAELISNTTSVVITSLIAVPKLQLSPNANINTGLNWGIKNAGKAAVMIPVNRALENVQ